jgi:hypothetical protein
MSFSVHCSPLGLSLHVLTDGVRDGGEVAGQDVEAAGGDGAEHADDGVVAGGDGAEHADDGVVGEEQEGAEGPAEVPVEGPVGADAREEPAPPERGDSLEVVDVAVVEGVRHEVVAERQHTPPRVRRVQDLVRLYNRM